MPVIIDASKDRLYLKGKHDGLVDGVLEGYRRGLIEGKCEGLLKALRECWM
ncbi:MAG: hypothetical protein SFH39_10920 [Candidatus Magnetobacterium sp. LHC-1]|uniref:Transposase n=1 Tax=Candidatus Magnetobacterium casense TaxID=1455061 RepID=A0ABS6RZR3_9BACT|nr:hypothetical protein [Candidatus Magnetobacterium casensis]MBF0607192.1 hypothetical protein [Nitrospirota bacterium]MBV6342051.1 hypothetical protein [Candidatus Magnetobacterium casensis]